ARPQPGTRLGSDALTRRLELHEPELPLAPLDHGDVALGEAPVFLRRERQDAADALKLLDVRLEAGADPVLRVADAGHRERHHADAVPRLAAIHVGLLAVLRAVARLVVEDRGLDRVAVRQLLGHRE